MINKAIYIIVSVAYKYQMLLNTKSREDQLLITSYDMKNDFMVKWFPGLTSGIFKLDAGLQQTLRKWHAYSLQFQRI